jgi:hypothetical protein
MGEGMKKMIKMKTMKGMSGGLLVALPGAVALFQGEVASSAVVFSGILSHQVPVTAQGTVVNFATGVVVNGAASGVPGWDINPYGTSGTNVALLAGSGTGIMRNPDAGTNTFRTYLPVGTVVGASAFFYGNSAAAMGTAVGQWAPNSEGYIGVRFLNEASSTPTTHYGFIHMRIGATATDRTIIGFGWETTANTAITTIPVPAPAAGLLALAAGFGIRRRRR